MWYDTIAKQWSQHVYIVVYCSTVLYIVIVLY
jgi:hypothetical protein